MFEYLLFFQYHENADIKRERKTMPEEIFFIRRCLTVGYKGVVGVIIPKPIQTAHGWKPGKTKFLVGYNRHKRRPTIVIVEANRAEMKKFGRDNLKHKRFHPTFKGVPDGNS